MLTALLLLLLLHLRQWCQGCCCGGAVVVLVSWIKMNAFALRLARPWQSLLADFRQVPTLLLCCWWV
jgi:hypothetical protein